MYNKPATNRISGVRALRCRTYKLNYVRPATTRRPSWVWSTSSTVDEFCWQHDRLVSEMFLNPEYGIKFEREVGLPSFLSYPNFLITQDRPRWKEAFMPKTARNRNHFSRTTIYDRQTEGHSIYRASVALRDKNAINHTDGWTLAANLNSDDLSTVDHVWSHVSFCHRYVLE